MRLRLVGVGIVMAALLVACAEGRIDRTVKTVEPEDNFKMLPAWRLPWEKKKAPGQADASFDFRMKHPEWYAATEAPKGKKFRAFLEWEPTQALLLAYPSGSLDKSVSTSIAMIAVHTAPHADVYIVAKAQTAKDKLIGYMKAGGLTQELIDKKIHWFDLEGETIWMIDFGPFSLLDDAGVLAFTDLRYYWDRVYDDASPARIAELWGITDYRGQLDFEGGNFNADGEGRCYHTQGAFWENPDKTQDEVHQVFKDFLGCETFVVLKPLAGEGTTHIDMLSKLTSPDTFVLGKYKETQDAKNAKVLDDDAAILEALDLGGGKKMKVVRIPMPDNTGQGEVVWRTYTNSTLVKPVNLWPVYSINTDIQKEAEAAWKEAMPYWEHIGILSDVIITWGGAMHCVSRNVPFGKMEKWIPDGTCGTDKKCVSKEGYDGACEDSTDCVGPKWLCECNDCAGGCKPPPDNCKGITLEGCCMPDGVLKFCESNAIQEYKCGSWDNCGWDKGSSWYDCNMSVEGPPGYPKLCSGGPCGTYTEKGKCEGDFLMACVDGLLKGTDCAKDKKKCGPDPADATKSACIGGEPPDHAEEVPVEPQPEVTPEQEPEPQPEPVPEPEPEPQPEGTPIPDPGQTEVDADTGPAPDKGGDDAADVQPTEKTSSGGCSSGVAPSLAPLLLVLPFIVGRIRRWR